MRFVNLISIVVLLFCTQNINAQGKVSSKTNIKKGILKNGLTYYIYNNPTSRGKANFYLIQNVGAILEEDDQNGLAHFLEHMCFKGTKHFPGKTIMNMFETKGLSSSINAYTQVEETVYYLNNVPVSDKIFLDKCLLILHDWCNYLSLDKEAIDSERPVIVEELRTRRDLKERLLEQISLVTHNHSKYSKRFVSGLPNIIKTFKKETLERFYNDWYRTDLQSVVVVGDVDVFDMEEKIKNLFSIIPPANSPRVRELVKIPDNTETLFVAAKDKEVKDGVVSINFRHKRKIYKSYKDKTSDDFIVNMINFMLRNRIATLLENDKENFVNLNIGNYKLTQGYDNYSIRVTHRKNKAKEALSEAISLHKDIMENGFTKEEFDKVKKGYLKTLENYKRFQNSMSNDAVFRKIKDNFIQGDNLLDASTEYKIFKELIKKLTLDDLKDKVNILYSGVNKGIVVVHNNKDERYLTKEDVLRIEKTVLPKKILPKNKDEEANRKSKDIVVKDSDFTGAKISKVENLETLGAEKWVLSNGATVIFKENEHTRDIINVTAVSLGGLSVLNGYDLLNGRMLRTFRPCIGIKGHNKDSFDDLLKSNQLMFDFDVTDDSEKIISGCKYKNVEKMFEVIYQFFENPTFYNDEFVKIIDNINKSIEGGNTKFTSLLRDSISLLTCVRGRNFRFNKEIASNVTREKLFCIFNQRFSDASNFTFYIVGGIGKNKAKKLAEKYIGSIKSTNSGESYKLFENPINDKYTRKILKFEMVDKKAGNVLIIDQKLNPTTKEKIGFKVIELFLREKLNKLLREQMNGTYGVKVSNIITKRSLQSCKYEVSYECDPNRIEELNKALLNKIKEIGKSGMSLDDFKKLISELNRSGVPRPDNRYYTNLLRTYMETGEDRSEKDFIKKIFDSIDVDFVNKLLIKYLRNAKSLDIIYVPK